MKEINDKRHEIQDTQSRNDYYLLAIR